LELGFLEAMYSNFKEQAIEFVRQAVTEDNAGNYAKAFPLYMNALEYFKTHLKYEKNPKIKEAITQKFTEYLRRAEEIRAVLDEGSGQGPTVNGDGALVAKPKSKPGSKDGGGGDGGDGEDPEQAKLRLGLNSAIIREKPNVKWGDVAGLESAKQALQEAVILPVKFPQFFTGASSSSIISSRALNRASLRLCFLASLPHTQATILSCQWAFALLDLQRTYLSVGDLFDLQNLF
jgi:vacuolar protein-sorting-associated protein 4